MQANYDVAQVLRKVDEITSSGWREAAAHRS
jgi:hypothetical protein